MEKTYKAKYNKVFQNIKTGEITGNTVTVKDGDSILNYKEIHKDLAAGQAKSVKTRIPYKERSDD